MPALAPSLLRLLQSPQSKCRSCFNTGRNAIFQPVNRCIPYSVLPGDTSDTSYTNGCIILDSLTLTATESHCAKPCYYTVTHSCIHTQTTPCSTRFKCILCRAVTYHYSRLNKTSLPIFCIEISSHIQYQKKKKGGGGFS